MRIEKLVWTKPVRARVHIFLKELSRIFFQNPVVWPISAWHHPPPSCNPAFKPLWPAVGLCGLLWASVACCGPLWPAVGLCGLLWARCAAPGAGRRAPGGGRFTESLGPLPPPPHTHTHTHTHTQDCYPALREEHKGPAARRSPRHGPEHTPSILD